MQATAPPWTPNNGSASWDDGGLYPQLGNGSYVDSYGSGSFRPRWRSGGRWRRGGRWRPWSSRDRRGRSRDRWSGRSSGGSSRSSRRSSSRRRGHDDKWYLGKTKDKTTFGLVTLTGDGPSRHNPRNPWNYDPKEVEGTRWKDWRFPSGTKITKVKFFGDGSGGIYEVTTQTSITSGGSGLKWGDLSDKFGKLSLGSDDGKKKGGGILKKWRSVDTLA